MKLRDLLEGIQYNCLQGSLDVDITHLAYDNRRVQAGGLFVCIQGITVDGHSFIDQAIEAGAVAVLVQHDVKDVPEHIAVIHVDAEETNMAQAVMANHLYNEPSKELKIVGITGTNGKTSTTNLIESIVKENNQKSAIIGTIENRIGDRVIKAIHTTPQAIDLQRLLRQMVEEKVDLLSMEVSSHALDMNRVYGTKYDVSIFTNLTLDHLDYHGTMENYLNAKAKLFNISDKGIFNLDDPHAEQMMAKASCEKFTYGINNQDADFNAVNVKMSAEGLQYTLQYDGKEYPIQLAIPGTFSVYNSLAAASACYLSGLSWDAIVKGLKSIKGVKGRFESVKSEDGRYAIVDYAHTPDALKNVLSTIREFVTGEVYTVFGCGGDRDPSKRPIMGRVAGEGSDFCIITSDNPRTEEPVSILDAIEPGVAETGCTYVKILDRKEAIQYALDKATEGDVILVAGKGHEDYQILGKVKVHFDDMEVIKEHLEAR